MAKINSRKEIIVTVICSLFVAITSILAALIAREKITTYEYREIPNADLVVTTDYFPLAVGNYWTYEGVATMCVVNSDKVIEKKVMITMSVENEVKNGNVALYILKGYPSDVAWALEPKHFDMAVIKIPPSKYGLLVVTNKIFSIEEDKLEQVIKAIKEDGYLPEGLISQGDLEFEFPLFKGLKFGEVNQITRNDLKYFWYVEDKSSFHEADKDKIKDLPEYKLVQNSLPEYVELIFSPYLGIISYKYSHHGSRCKVSVSLKNYEIHPK